MDIIGLIVSLVSGAIGGNVAGRSMPNFSLGTNGNSIAGIVGGLLGGTGIASNLLGLGGGDMVPNIITHLVGGLVGGGVALPIVGVVRRMMGNN